MICWRQRCDRVQNCLSKAASQLPIQIHPEGCVHVYIYSYIYTRIHICLRRGALVRHWEAKRRPEEVWKGCGERQSSFRRHAVATVDSANAFSPFLALLTLAKLPTVSPPFVAPELGCCRYRLGERPPPSGASAGTGSSNFSPSLAPCLPPSLSISLSFSPSPLLLQLISSGSTPDFNTLISSSVPAGSHTGWWAVADLHRHVFLLLSGRDYCWLIDRRVN